MTDWRKTALAISPSLREDLELGIIEEDFNIYDVFFDLLPRCEKAHKAGNEKELAEIYAFAEWCFHQKDKELWNAVGVAFYEHLVDEPIMREAIPKRLTPEVFEGVSTLFEWRLGEDEFANLRQTFYEHQASSLQEKIDAAVKSKSETRSKN